MSVEAAGTIAAALIASGTGVASYIANARSRRTEAALRETDKTAELAAAEVTGWKTLIESLNEQYRAARREASELRERLAVADDHFRTATLALEHAREEVNEGIEAIHRLEKVCQTLRADVHDLTETKREQEQRIVVLRREVDKLGGDVEKINNHGKQGPVGPKGPRGEPGEHG